MRFQSSTHSIKFWAIGVILALSLGQAAAQTVQFTKTETRTTTGGNPSTTDADKLQEPLLDLLRQTPTLAGAIARDPSLLAEQSYIQRSNPQLAAFLAAHPEVARNPDYYLFTNLRSNSGNRQQALQRELWPEYMHSDSNRDDPFNTFIREDLTPIIVIPGVFFALAWGLRSLLAGRRQSKILKAQGDLQSRLIDKLGSSQELTAYLSSEAGQKLLSSFGAEALSTPTQMQIPFTFERILRPLQIGAVLVLLSAGALVLRAMSQETSAQLSYMVTTIVLFTAGTGFILSAGIAWTMAKKLGVLPTKPSLETETLDRP
jgi:hypothetical protein